MCEEGERAGGKGRESKDERQHIREYYISMKRNLQRYATFWISFTKPEARYKKYT